MTRQTFTVVLALTMIMGCTWVKPTREGDKVRILNASDIANCKQIGETKATLMAKVAGYNRDPRQVQRELDILAQNAAVDMGGDAVTPLDKPRVGKQSYYVYKCAEPEWN